MSSIVKKSSRFAPKLKKKPIRRKNQADNEITSVSTPPSTQASTGVDSPEVQAETPLKAILESQPETQPGEFPKDVESGNGSNTHLITPQATQITQDTQETRSSPITQDIQTKKDSQSVENLQINEETQTTQRAQTSQDITTTQTSLVFKSPRKLQISEKPTFNFSLSTTQASPSKSNNDKTSSLFIEEEHDDVDPKDVSRGSVIGDSAITDNEDYGDNDIFKKPEDHMITSSMASFRRRSSVKSQRRLSGITQTLKPRSGSVSISLTPTPRGSVGPDGIEPHPVGVAINKRRRSSLAPPQSIKKPALIQAPTNIYTPRQLTPEIPEENPRLPPAREFELEEQNNVMNVHANDKDEDIKLGSDDEFVIGIDPTLKKRKLRKYRKRTEENKNEIPPIKPKKKEGDPPIKDETEPYIPVAPINLIRSVSSLKDLPKTTTVEDAKYFSRIRISSDKITMAELCKPTISIGKLSSNYKRSEEAQKILQKRTEKRRNARLLARTERISLEDAIKRSENEKDREARRERELIKKKQAKNLLDSTEEPRDNNGLTLSLIDGEVRLNNDSTLVERHPKIIERSNEAYEENPFAEPVTSALYSKRRHTDKWTGDELLIFYNALSTWGTDFLFIAQLFPYRTRKQVKLKFVIEEKRFPEIIELALQRRLPSDFKKYCEDTNNKFLSMEEYEEELEELKAEHDRHMLEITEGKERAMQEDLEASRRREIEIRTGTKPMTRAEKTRELRKNEMVVGTIDDVKRKIKEN